MQIYAKYKENSHYLSLASLYLIPAGLLFSRAILSIGFITFIANWFLEGNFKSKSEMLKLKWPAMLVVLIFFIHLAGMLHTENKAYGLEDLKIKLPLLLPFFYGSSEKISKILNINNLLLTFAISTGLATLAGFLNFQFFFEFQTVDDLKNISLMGQNIMLSWFVNFSIFILANQLFYQRNKNSLLQVFIYLSLLIWLLVFLYLLNSLTGYLTFAVLVVFCLLFILFSGKNKKIIIYGSSALALLIISSVIYIYLLSENFHKTETVDFINIEQYTANGNPYYHNIASQRTENGHFIDIYICDKELEKEWNKVSKLNYRELDNKGQVLSETIYRYLSSKGLRKDSAGLSKLNQNDISFIENGCANYLYINKYSPTARIYNILWQMDKYRKTGNASAQSISQRIEFMKAAKYIIQKNFWFGVGSGDVMDTFHKTLEILSPKLEPQYRNRVHNQYIVEFIALGILGFLIFLILIILPVFYLKIWKNFLFSVFFIIVYCSFFTDNPLETQLGVSLFAFFYSLFSFDILKNKMVKTNEAV
ncbi:MAG: O-antigen ligase family protein [Bacteroidales bacterium]